MTVELTDPEIGSAKSTRVRLIEGALECLRRDQKVTFSDVARTSGIARQTVYAHFADKDELFTAAIQHAAVDLSRSVGARVAALESTEDALVEMVVAFHEAAQLDPAIAQVVEMTLHPATADHGTISSRSLELTRAFLRTRADLKDLAVAELEEIAEVLLRFLLSVLSYRSRNTETSTDLRAFLQRRMVPTLRLPSPRGQA